MRRSTEVASSASRVCGSSPSSQSSASSCATVGSIASSGASGRARTAEAASCSDSGWPRTKRLTHSACSRRARRGAAPRPRRRARAGRAGPSAAARRTRPPGGARRVTGGDARRARARAARAGASRPQPAVDQPQALGRVDHEQDERPSGSRCPTRGPEARARVGSTSRPSTAITVAPRAAASARKARSSDDLPAPATPWTTAAGGASSSSRSAGARRRGRRWSRRARPAALRASPPRRQARGRARDPARRRRLLDRLDRVGREHQPVAVGDDRLGAGRLVDAEPLNVPSSSRTM